MSAYYNENDPAVAAWLRELVAQDLLPAGEVDERSIEDVRPGDLTGFEQCHFFAGIGGWPYALKLAEWDGPVWTGSCPCQPFSTAGKGKGVDDERHLWPEFRWLIDQCRPAVVFGEQVASPAGRTWLSGIRADFQELGYALGAADLCAASVGAPHIRQRLYWGAGRLADSDGGQSRNKHVQSSREHRQQPQDCDSTGRLGNTDSTGSQGRQCDRDGADQWPSRASGLAGAWSDFDTIPCSDGKARRVESGSFPLAHGIPARVVRLRGYGNAIVPQVGAEFVRAFDRRREP